MNALQEEAREAQETRTVPINTVVTTFGFSSLEAAFLKALLGIRRVRENLGITKDVKWEFQSTAVLVKQRSINPEDAKAFSKRTGIVYFNVNGGVLDQHGRPENESLCTLCSLDLVRGQYDFLQRRPWLREIYAKVRANDIDGRQLSKSDDNIRRIMDGLGILYSDPAHVLHVLCTAFEAIFHQAKEGVSIDQVFNVDQILIGAQAILPEDDFQAFRSEVNSALMARENDWKQALQDVDNAVRTKKARTISCTYGVLGRNKLRIIMVYSDARSAAAATRYKGFDVAIIVRSNGHVQILSSIMKIKGGRKFKFNFAYLAMKLRILEAAYAKPKRQWIERTTHTDLDFKRSGYVYYTLEDAKNPDNIGAKACPWYLAEFLSGLFNGSLSSPDVPATEINHQKIFGQVCDWLGDCDLLEQVGEGEWQHYK